MLENDQKNYPEERRLVSVLSAEISGFSELADQQDFELASRVIRRVWEKLAQVIVEYGGYIDQQRGESFLVLWGAPEAREDDAERSVSAGLAVLKSLEEFKEESDHPFAKNFQIQVGIHSGLVLAGYLGIRGEYSVMGDTVRIARRMKESADPGSLLISEAAYQFIRGAFQVKRLDPIELIGTQRLTNVYQVIEPLLQPSKLRYRSKGGLRTNLVGREQEIDKLKQYFFETQERRKPSYVLVTGDIGVGKSRLLMEFVSKLEADYPQLTLMSSRALEQTQQVPYSMWKELWFNRFNLNEDDPIEEVRKKLIEGVLTLWGRQLGEYPAVEAAHFIGHITGVHWESSRYLEKYREDQKSRRQRSFMMHGELFYRALLQGPVVLILDDLQWADRGSLDLINYLRHEHPKDMPLLILAGARQAFIRDHPELVQGGEIIELTPLPTESEIVRKAYPALKMASDQVLKFLAQRSAGNPYFLEELVKTVVSRSWESLSPAELDQKLPDSLEKLLQSCLDSLSMEARATALFAAVVGRVFWEGAVLAAFRDSEGVTAALQVSSYDIYGKVQKALDELMEKEMAFPRVGSAFSAEKEYIFKHSLLREVAYDRLPKEYQEKAHLAVAHWLADRASKERSVSVAHHFEVAGNHDLALRFYTEAAEYARWIGNEDEADQLQFHARTL